MVLRKLHLIPVACVATLLTLAHCGGAPSGTGTATGAIGVQPVWEQPDGSMTSSLPSSARRLRISLRPGSGRPCCIAINPASMINPHVVVLNKLPVGPATVAIAGFETDFAPLPSGMTDACATDAATAQPCDSIQPAAPSYESEPATTVVTRPGTRNRSTAVRAEARPFVFDLVPSPLSVSPNPTSVRFTLGDAVEPIDADSVRLEISQDDGARPDTELQITACNDKGDVPCSAGGVLRVTGFKVETAPREYAAGIVRLRIRARSATSPHRGVDFSYTFVAGPPLPTASPTRTLTLTPSAIPSLTPTRTAPYTASPTQTATRLPTATASRSPSSTATFSPTPTVTRTSTPSVTHTASTTATPTATPTRTATRTPRPTLDRPLFAYVANYDDSTVTIIELQSQSPSTTLSVDRRPAAVATLRGGSAVYVTNQLSASVQVIDTGLNRLVTTISSGLGPKDIAFAPDGRRAYVTAQLSNAVSVIDTTARITSAAFPVAGLPEGIAITPDGMLLYVTTTLNNEVAVLSASDGTEVTRIAVGVQPQRIAIATDGALAYVSNRQSNTLSVIATATNTVVDTIEVGVNPNSLVISPDDAFVYVCNELSDSVTVIDALTRMTTSLAVGSRPRGIAITPDGALLVVANSGSDDVSLIDADSGAETQRIAVGRSPSAVSVALQP